MAVAGFIFAPAGYWAFALLNIVIATMADYIVSRFQIGSYLLSYRLDFLSMICRISFEVL